MRIRIISDVHGKYNKFFPLLTNADHFIQLGDLGFNYLPVEEYVEKNNISLVVIAGNHENYETLSDENLRPRFFLPKFGNYGVGDLTFFFVQGAFSIDWKLRKMKYFTGEWPVTWWEEEELTRAELETAYTMYEGTKPDTVITHDCPRSIANLIGDPAFLKDWGYNHDTFNTRTSEALQCMFEAHQPKLWMMGHYHADFDRTINGTRFICKKELGFTDLTVENGKVISIK